MLAYEETGKYVSERHAVARSEGKLTAGEMAKKLNNQFKIEPKIKATELKLFATEWHHSGFYKGGGGSTMGRTYFFNPDCNLNVLLSQIQAARLEEANRSIEADVVRYFFMPRFERQTGRYGKVRWQPLADITAVTCKPSDSFNAKAIEISRDDYELLKSYDGYELEPYETFTHFKTRMEVKNDLQSKTEQIA